MDIRPVELTRDENGFWYHPDIPWDRVPEEQSPAPYLNFAGYETHWSEMYDELSNEENDQYANSNSPDVSFWAPKVPAGPEWFLAAIYDTEDGPVALWIRPLQA